MKGSNMGEVLEIKVDSPVLEVNQMKDKALAVVEASAQKVEAVTKQVKTVEEAVKAAGLLNTTKEKVNYLLGQATGFFNSREFKKVVDIAQYILNNLDGESTAAKNLLENAKQSLVSKAKESLGVTTENLKSKIGLLGQ